MKRPRSRVEDYAIAWICALSVELSAATIILDERYDDIPELAQYILGRVGSHNVVITCLPSGQYGTNSAALTAAELQSRFPCIQYWLMVGIGGGVPTAVNDIRLGDVVVSQPQNQHGGVIQYDLGKTGLDGRQIRTGMLNAPPPVLGRAVSKMRSAHDIGKGKLKPYLSAFSDFPVFQRVSTSSDRLFKPEYQHSGETTCQHCSRDETVSRPPRKCEDTVVHFGLIASGNQVIKDGIERNRLSSELGGALCFEMEAAGLANAFPCLVIRGICDYADSHKTKQWQRFAASSAAACAKELLSYVSSMPASFSDNTPQPFRSTVRDRADVLGLQSSPSSTSSDPVAPSDFSSTFVRLPLSDDQRDQFMQSLTFENINSRHTTIRQAHTKTCQWILQRPEYLLWLDNQHLRDHHGFFWIKGNPGTGKSTLLKFALAKMSKAFPDAVFVSFFFNARGDELEKSTLGLYRSVLFQLLHLIPRLQDVFSICRPRNTQTGPLSWEIDTLKSALEQVVGNLQNCSLMFFIDALDECDEDEIRDMVSLFENLGTVALAHNVQLRIFFTSRHYPHVTVDSSIQLVLEDQDDHQQDIAKYLHTELKASHSKFVDDIRAEILQRSSGIFLWVVLVVQILNKEFQRGNKHAVKKRLTEIPDGLERLFEDILTRDGQDIPRLVLCVQCVLFAQRPLKAEELHCAVLFGETGCEESYSSSHEIESEDIKMFILNISKGLVEETKTKHRTIQFIHESVRDFFLKGRGLDRPFFGPFADFEARSHEVLKRCCHNYLTKAKAEKICPGSMRLPKANTEEAAIIRQGAREMYPLLEYSVQHVLSHANQAERLGVSQRFFMEQLSLQRWVALNNVLEPAEIRRYTTEVSLLYILAEKDLSHLIPSEFDRVGSMEIRGERHGFPLIAAQASSNEGSMRILLRCHVKDAFEDPSQNVDKAVTSLLKSRTPFRKSDECLLRWAIRTENDDLCQILLGDTEYIKHNFVESNLLIDACSHGCAITVERMIAGGHHLPDFTTEYFTPISHSLVQRNDVEMTKVFLNADLHINDSSYLFFVQNVLPYAIRDGVESFVELILAHVPTRGIKREALVAAAEKGYQTIVELLLARDLPDKWMDEALVVASDNNHQNIVKLLLAQYSSVEMKTEALMRSSDRGDWRAYRIISEASVQVERCGGVSMAEAQFEFIEDVHGQLMIEAAVTGRTEVISAILDKCSASTLLTSADGSCTPVTTYVNRALKVASLFGHLDIVQKLVACGANINHKSKSGYTALFMASSERHIKVVQYLTDIGARIDYMADEYCSELRRCILGGSPLPLDNMFYWLFGQGQADYLMVRMAYVLATLGSEYDKGFSLARQSFSLFRIGFYPDGTRGCWSVDYEEVVQLLHAQYERQHRLDLHATPPRDDIDTLHGEIL